MKLTELPKCPECNVSLSFWQSFKNVNSKSYKCPVCEKSIVASQKWKKFNVVGSLIALFIGVLAIFLEKQGYWQTVDSMLFFLTCLTVGTLITYFTWLHVEFKRQDEPKEVRIAGNSSWHCKMSKVKKFVFPIVAIPLFAFLYLGAFHTQWLFFYINKFKHGNQIQIATEAYWLSTEYAIATVKKGKYLAITKDNPIGEHNLFFDQISNHLKEGDISQLDEASSTCLVLKDIVETDKELRLIKLLLMKRVLLVVETKSYHGSPYYFCDSISRNS